MAKQSFSIVPDALVNAGTGFGILLGLAVGLMTGIMVGPEQVTKTVTATDALPDAREQAAATVRTLFAQRASLTASVLRLDGAGQSAAQPLQLLERNSAAFVIALNAESGTSLGQPLIKALDDQLQDARNVVALTAAENPTGLAEAQRSLRASTSELVAAVAGGSDRRAADAARPAEKITAAITALAATVKQTTTYQAESNLVASFDELAAFLRSNR